MKTYRIDITGDGTAEEISDSLRDIADEIRDKPELFTYDRRGKMYFGVASLETIFEESDQ